MLRKTTHRRKKRISESVLGGGGTLGGAGKPVTPEGCPEEGSFYLLGFRGELGAPGHRAPGRPTLPGPKLSLEPLRRRSPGSPLPDVSGEST